MLRALVLLPVAAATMVVAAPTAAYAEPNCLTVGTTVVVCDEEDPGTLSQPHPTTVQLDGARVEVCWYLTSPSGLCVGQDVSIGETGVVRPSATVDPTGVTTVPPICYRGTCTPSVDVPIAVVGDFRTCPNGDYLIAYVIAHGIGFCVGLPPDD